MAIRFAQRFGISNPSPRYIDTIATAFKDGVFRDPVTGIEFGSNNYGDLGALTAAVLLDREARSVILDADPSYGSLLEPFLKVVRIFKSLTYLADDDRPFVDFFANLQDMLGQEPHQIPSVFSYFLPEYKSAGE